MTVIVCPGLTAVPSAGEVIWSVACPKSSLVEQNVTKHMARIGPKTKSFGRCVKVPPIRALPPSPSPDRNENFSLQASIGDDNFGSARGDRRDDTFTLYSCDSSVSRSERNTCGLSEVRRSYRPHICRRPVGIPLGRDTGRAQTAVRPSE